MSHLRPWGAASAVQLTVMNIITGGGVGIPCGVGGLLTG